MRYIFLFIAFVLSNTLAPAQVKLTFNSIIGKVDETTLTDIDLSHFLRVELEMIYHGQILAEDGTVLYEVRSDVFKTHKFGKEKVGPKNQSGFQVLVNQGNIKSYYGKVRFFGEMLHPLDQSSIICQKEELVLLKNGVVYELDGKIRVTDEAFDWDWNYKYGATDFSKASLFDLVFDNQNLGPYCEDLKFEIRIAKENKLIYAATLPNVCFPSGKSTLTESQLKYLDVTLDDYKNRPSNKKLKASIRMDRSQSSNSRTVEASAHSKQSLEMGNYHSEAANFSIDFIEDVDFGDMMEVPAPNYPVFQLKNNGSFVALDYKLSPQLGFGVNNPYGIHLGRSDINGEVRVQIFKAADLNQGQTRNFLASLLGIEASAVKARRMEDFTVFYPKQFDNKNSLEKKSIMGMFIVHYEGFAFMVQARKKKESTSITTIDFNRVLNSFELNGTAIRFDFAKDRSIKKLELKRGKHTQKKSAAQWKSTLHRCHLYAQSFFGERDYSASKTRQATLKKLLSGQKTDKKLPETPFPGLSFVMPNGTDTRQVKQVNQTKMGVQFNYIALGKHKKETLDQTYTYEVDTDGTLKGVTTFMNAGVSMNSDYQQVKAKNDQVEISGGGFIISVDKTEVQPAFNSKTYGSLIQMKTREKPSVFEQKANNWTFFALPKLGKSFSNTNFFAFVLKNQNAAYDVQLRGMSDADLDLFFESLRIEGQAFKIDFKDKKVVGFGLK